MNIEQLRKELEVDEGVKYEIYNSSPLNTIIFNLINQLNITQFH